MKTKKKLSSLVVIVLLMMGFTIAKAQSTIPFTNKLSCAVTLIYESWDPNNGCSNCSNGTITIQPNSTVNVPTCCTTCGHCVVLTDIGGTSITNNHSGTSTCHWGQVNNSGPLPSGCFSQVSTTSYTIVHFSTSWTIF
jgi:MinD superfamily P-loop ATPase